MSNDSPQEPGSTDPDVPDAQEAGTEEPPRRRGFRRRRDLLGRSRSGGSEKQPEDPSIYPMF